MAKRFVRVAAFVLLFVGLTAGAYAQITIHGGLALSTMEVKAGGNSEKGSVGIGGNVSVDYLLKTKSPLSVGGEIGADSASVSVRSGVKDTVTAIPILARVAYHFKLPPPKLDLYVLGKLGYAVGIWKGDMKDMSNGDNPGGFGFGFDLGAAYYFTKKIGAFAEVGFDRYLLKTEAAMGGPSKTTLDMPLTRFLTAGVSVKL
jgi:hypothetical protein